jgi:hypothetical protein
MGGALTDALLPSGKVTLMMYSPGPLPMSATRKQLPLVDGGNKRAPDGMLIVIVRPNISSNQYKNDTQSVQDEFFPAVPL